MIITNSLRPAVVILVPIHKQKTVLAVEEFGTVIIWYSSSRLKQQQLSSGS